jgi:short-subunit dehydrogenase
MAGREGQVALITGAGGGLGKALAHALAKAGVHLILVDRAPEPLESIRTELQSSQVRVVAAVADISDEQALHVLVQAALSEFGRIDILMNCAGINRVKPFEELSAGDVQAVVGVNLLGVILCTRAVYPQMIKQGGGTIVNIGSVNSLKVADKHSLYSATKFGLLGFSRALMLEGRKHNIQVMVLLPSGMATTWYADRPEVDTSQMMRPESVAGIVLQLLQAPPDLVAHEVILGSSTASSWP